MPFNPPGSPLNYPTNDTNAVRIFKINRAPTSNDSASFEVRDFWIDDSSDDLYFLINKGPSGGLWTKLGGTGGQTETLEGNSGGPVPPDASNNILTVGTGPFVVTGNPGTNTLEWSTDGTLATQYDADSGNAIPSAGILNIVSGVGAATTASGNTITVSATGTAWNWQEDTVGAVSLVNRTGYFANGGAQIQYDLPATAAQGDDYKIVAKSASGFKIQANAGQAIRVGNQLSSSGGDIQSIQIGDVVEIVCMTANTEFIVMDMVGNISIN